LDGGLEARNHPLVHRRKRRIDDVSRGDRLAFTQSRQSHQGVAIVGVEVIRKQRAVCRLSHLELEEIEPRNRPALVHLEHTSVVYLCDGLAHPEVRVFVLDGLVSRLGLAKADCLFELVALHAHDIERTKTPRCEKRACCHP
jgi:hypothetical protein